ncbi:MAG: tetratricopeptide repeat protein [Desulfuromonadaceae bacterium]|nr:tetratricopeptide repeat protein [Desulfuromonadaceae bacterium]MDD5104154.1 tetratricopeptide repeat protein [Desulfuromonadaceae bacterium]
MAIDATSGSSDIFSVIAMQQTLRENSANTALSNGIALMQKKKYSQAALAFKQASIYKPELTEAYTFLGDAYTRLGKKKEAIDTYKLSLKVDRAQDALYTNIAGLYVDLGKPAEAEKSLRDGIKQNDQNTLAYYTLGLLESKSGKYVDAEKQFRKVIRLEPKDGNGYYALGMALNGQGKYDDAISYLKKATTLKKDFSAAINELGKAYAGIGDLDKTNEQIARLNKIGTSDAVISATELTDQITRPGIYYADSVTSSFNLNLGPISLLAIDSSTFITPNASKEVTVKFVFNSDMEASSVTNITNWSISKASGGTAGIYNNGFYNPLNIAAPTLPQRVSYDPVAREATLAFTLTQNSSGDGVIDPSHLVFKFNGTDVKGKTMDPLADQYNGYRGSPF